MYALSLYPAKKMEKLLFLPKMQIQKKKKKKINHCLNAEGSKRNATFQIVQGILVLV